jgi:hypothetical protein
VFRVKAFGFQGLRFRFMVSGSEFRIQDLGFLL